MPTTREWAEALEKSADIWRKRAEWYDKGGEWPDGICPICGYPCNKCPLGKAQGGECFARNFNSAWGRWKWGTIYNDTFIASTAARQLAEQLSRLAAEYKERA